MICCALIETFPHLSSRYLALSGVRLSSTHASKEIGCLSFFSLEFRLHVCGTRVPGTRRLLTAPEHFPQLIFVPPSHFFSNQGLIQGVPWYRRPLCFCSVTLSSILKLRSHDFVGRAREPNQSSSDHAGNPRIDTSSSSADILVIAR